MKNRKFFNPSSGAEKRKGAVEMPFAWLFSLIVGAFILFLAIFAVVKIMQTENVAIDAATAKEVGVLLNPLETGFEAAKTTSLILPKDTRIYNRCTKDETFGRQTIRLSQKNFGKWSDTDVNVGFSNKYLFSNNYTEGKKFFIFSKPFEFPFKIADVIYITSANDKYCFENSPADVSDELSNLGQENIFIKDCPANSVRVCFSGNCEIRVNLESKYVEKRDSKMYFTDNTLMYAAIFSDSDTYECQLKRLMQRGEELTSLYIEKSNIIAAKGCSSNLGNDLSVLSSQFNVVDSSVNLNSAVVDAVQNIGVENGASNCKLW